MLGYGETLPSCGCGVIAGAHAAGAVSFFAGAFECDVPRLGDVKGLARGGRVATLSRPLAFVLPFTCISLCTLRGLIWSQVELVPSLQFYTFAFFTQPLPT